MNDLDRLDAAKDEARQRWGRSSPFRLGLLSVKYRIANPYDFMMQRTAWKNFYAGVDRVDELKQLTEDSRKGITHP